MDVRYSRPALFQHGGTVEAKNPAAARGEAIEPAGKYLECLRNHAPSAGGYVVDGCGEFMPAAGPADPASLRCAACGCHRSFHRRAGAEGPPPPSPPPPLALLPPPSAVAAPHVQREGRPPGHREPGAGADDWDDETDEGSDHRDDDDRPMSPLLAPPPEYFAITSASQMLFALGAGAQAPGSPAPAPAAPAPVPLQGASLAAARKRFRTRFSLEQKQRMRALAEQLGWRLQKRGDAIEGCCREIGVTRGVFKAWMHNNKHSFIAGHRDASASPDPAVAGQPASSHHAAPPPPPPAASATAPPVHSDFNVNCAADDYFVVKSATAMASAGTQQSS